MRLFIKARGLEGFLTGAKTQPLTGDTTFVQWESENSLVMAWLINSMVPSVAQGMSFFETAQKIWKAAARTYSQYGNTTQAFELKRKIRALKQDNFSVIDYMAEFQRLWSELDFYRPFKASYASDAAEFKKFTDEERIFDFLGGLNEEFDPIKVQILGRSLICLLSIKSSH